MRNLLCGIATATLAILSSLAHAQDQQLDQRAPGTFSRAARAAVRTLGKARLVHGRLRPERGDRSSSRHSEALEGTQRHSASHT